MRPQDDAQGATGTPPWPVRALAWTMVALVLLLVIGVLVMGVAWSFHKTAEMF